MTTNHFQRCDGKVFKFHVFIKVATAGKTIRFLLLKSSSAVYLTLLVLINRVDPNLSSNFEQCVVQRPIMWEVRGRSYTAHLLLRERFVRRHDIVPSCSSYPIAQAMSQKVQNKVKGVYSIQTLIWKIFDIIQTLIQVIRPCYHDTKANGDVKDTRGVGDAPVTTIVRTLSKALRPLRGTDAQINFSSRSLSRRRKWRVVLLSFSCQCQVWVDELFLLFIHQTQQRSSRVRPSHGGTAMCCLLSILR